jgi:hypothetical protein
MSYYVIKIIISSERRKKELRYKAYKSPDKDIYKVTSRFDELGMADF